MNSSGYGRGGPMSVRGAGEIIFGSDLLLWHVPTTGPNCRTKKARNPDRKEIFCPPTMKEVCWNQKKAPQTAPSNRRHRYDGRRQNRIRRAGHCLSLSAEQRRASRACQKSWPANISPTGFLRQVSDIVNHSRLSPKDQSTRQIRASVLAAAPHHNLVGRTGIDHWLGV